MSIVERKKARHLGTFRQARRLSYVEVRLKRRSRGRSSQHVFDIAVGEPPREAKDGDLVEVVFLDDNFQRGGVPGNARVEKVLGKGGTHTAEIAKLLVEFDLDSPFPDNVVSEAKAFGTEVKVPKEAREDLRDLCLVTIDGATARDFDDAVFATRHNDGYRLVVAIADVAHYVTPQSALDREAYRRATSTYLPDRAIPMLPEQLSNGLCSLNPQVDRLCIFAEIFLDAKAEVKSTKLGQGIMNSKMRLTYESVAKFDETKTLANATKGVTDNLSALFEVSRKLNKIRRKRGAIDLDLPEPVVVFENDLPTDIAVRSRNDAHRLIEELMLLANEVVAQHFLEQEIDTLFRVHETPDPTKLESFTNLCRELGFEAHLTSSPKPKKIARLLDKLSEHPSGKTLHRVLLRCLSQARYTNENLGHYGLASSAYLHFTSPIRRYPDLVVHRQLAALVNNKNAQIAKLDEMGIHCSDRERAAMEAERAAIDLERAFVARELVGEELEGEITGVTNFGIFVSTQKPFLDGLVPMMSLPEDFYEPDASMAFLRGVNTGNEFGARPNSRSPSRSC